MNHPFKKGDKVVRLPDYQKFLWTRGSKVVTVTDTAYYGDGKPSVYVSGCTRAYNADRFRAAIAGQDYDVPTKRTDVYQGHLPDGSSVQAHSAGGLYPFVLVWRDKRNGPDAYGKYDVGVIGPTNQDPIWCPCSDHAIKLAEAIKEYKL